MSASETTAEQQTLAAASNLNHPVPAVRSVPGHPTQHAPPNRGLYEWTARIECNKFELSCSYSVIIFLGHVPDDPEEWQISPSYVGSHHAFVNTAVGECENKAGVIIEGFVHLNQAIVRLPGLKSLEPDVVVPYLTKNLHWRVLTVDCEPAKLNSLEVTVHATPLSFPPGAIFPVPGEPRRYDRITYGQEGGSRHPPT